jgi:hypothetical protein
MDSDRHYTLDRCNCQALTDERGGLSCTRRDVPNLLGHACMRSVDVFDVTITAAASAWLVAPAIRLGLSTAILLSTSTGHTLTPGSSTETCPRLPRSGEGGGGGLRCCWAFVGRSCASEAGVAEASSPSSASNAKVSEVVLSSGAAVGSPRFTSPVQMVRFNESDRNNGRQKISGFNPTAPIVFTLTGKRVQLIQQGASARTTGAREGLIRKRCRELCLLVISCNTTSFVAIGSWSVLATSCEHVIQRSQSTRSLAAHRAVGVH